MTLTGKVFDSTNGKPLVNVTVWEIDNDGQAANVIGFTDGAGSYSVAVDSSDSNINFVTDGYTGVSIPATQAQASDAVLLVPDGSVTAKLTLSGIPSWVWVVLAFAGIFFLDNGKKKK
jgi:hypothetical protein